MGRRDFLLQELDALIGRFRDDSRNHKRQYRRLRYTVFGLTALSTVLAGSALVLPESGALLSLAILVVSALSGLVTSIEGVRKPAELWVHERATYVALLDLKREVEYGTDAGTAIDQIDRCFVRLQRLLGGSAEKWGGIAAAGRGSGDGAVGAGGSAHSGALGNPAAAAANVRSGG